MAFQSAPNYALLEVIYQLVTGQRIENTFHFHFNGPGSYAPADLQDLADAADVWVDTDMLPLLSTDLTYVECSVRGLTLLNDFVRTANANAGAGAVSAADNPPQVTWCAKRVSALTGRSARGRIYMPPPVASQMLNNESVTTTYANAVVAALDDVIPMGQTAGFDHVILSRYTSGVLRATATGFPVLNYAYTDLTVDTQRRRLT